MAFVTNAITGIMDMDASPTVQAFKVGESSAKGYKAETEKAMASATDAAKKNAVSTTNSFKGMLADVKGELGKSSVLGQTAKLLAGGGAVAGFALAGNQVKDFTQQILDMKKELRGADADWESVTEKVGASLPIFGSFFQAGLNIREAITGEKAALQEAQDSLKIYDDYLVQHKKIIAEVAAGHREAADSIRKMREEMAQMGKTGISRDLGDIIIKTNERVAEAWKNGGATDELKKQLADADAALKKLSGPGDAPTRRLGGAFTIPGKGSISIPGESDDAFGSRMEEYKKSVAKYNNDLRVLQKAKQDIQDKISARSDDAFHVANVTKAFGVAEAANLFKSKWTETIDSWSSDFKKRTEENRAAIQKNMVDVLKQTRQMNMTDSQKKVDDFSHMPGVKPSEITQYKYDIGQLDAATKNKEFSDHVKDMIESVKTPLQKFTQARIDWMRALATGQVNGNQFNLGVAQSWKETVGANYDPNRRPGLIMAGSAEGQALREQQGGGVVDVAKQSLEVHKNIYKKLSDLVSAFPKVSPSQVLELST